MDYRKSVFAACKRLGIDQEERHALQRQITGKASSTEFDDRDWSRLLDHLNKMTGAHTAPPWAGKPQTWRAGCEALGGKIEALLADMGLPWRYLTHSSRGPSMVRRLAGVDRLKFADHAGLSAIIAALSRRAEKQSKAPDALPLPDFLRNQRNLSQENKQKP